MNIVVVSNFYPPHHVGGYEIGCHDVVEALRRRGHRVRVLTSVHGVARASSEGDVYRWLSIDLSDTPRSSLAFARSLLAAEVSGGRALARLVTQTRPDVVYACNLRYLPLSIARHARRLDLPVCYLVSDDWLAHWETVDRWEQWAADRPAHPLKRGLKRLLHAALERTRPAGRGDGLDLRHVQFVSHYLKQACLESGKPVDRAKVVHWGVDIRRFGDRHDGRGAVTRSPRLLYAGQVVASKGVHTAIEACRLLVQTHGMAGVELTIAGGSVQPSYRERLQGMVRAAGLGDRVRFTGAVGREAMPGLYREHDVLIFPSVCPEALSITVLEAMASGLPVIGTVTGGNGEIVRDGVNALVFPPEDSAACARQVRTLVTEPGLYERIRREARHTVESAFDLEHMVDAIERDLEGAVGTAR